MTCRGKIELPGQRECFDGELTAMGLLAGHRCPTCLTAPGALGDPGLWSVMGVPRLSCRTGNVKCCLQLLGLKDVVFPASRNLLRKEIDSLPSGAEGAATPEERS